MCLGIAEIYKQPITKILSNVPVKTIDDLTTDPLVCSDDFSEVFRVELGGEVGRFDEVNEHHRELSAFRVRRRCSRERFNLSGWLCLHNGLRCWLSSLRIDCLGSCSFTSPHQHTIVLIDRQALGMDDLFFQVLDVHIVYAKLSFQGTVGHTPLALEQCEDLSNHLVEVRHRLSESTSSSAFASCKSAVSNPSV